MSIKKTDMAKLSKMKDVDKAKALAVEILQGSNTAGNKKARLIADIKGYSRVDRILKTMWNAFLSGEKLGSLSSGYGRAMAEELDLVEYYEAMNESLVSFVLTEAKSDYTIYHKTFSSAVQHAIEVVEKRGYAIDGEEWDRKVALGPKKPSSGKTNIYTIDLMKDGKPTPRKLQMQVYYDQGRFELNMYIS